MNARSIEKLRKKFILVATLSFVAVMLLIASLIYSTNLLVTRREIRGVMNYIISNRGNLPNPQETIETESTFDGASEEPESHGEDAEENDKEEDQKTIMELSLADFFGTRNRLYLSPEFIYSTRYFAVLFDENENVTEIKTSHIAAVNREEAEEYARTALRQFFKFGSFGVFYYKVAKLEDGGTIVVYLDSTSQVTTSNRLLFTALALIGLGMIIAFLVMRFLSFHVVRAEIQNAERQKQFITNASHELKTPLAVIRANTEVEQMINGENEWNTSTMRQVDRLTGLIANLVMIVRAEEKENDTPREVIDISKVVDETADTFLPVAASEGKELKKEIAEAVSLKAEESEIRQLVSLLTDNAIKYCDDGGSITVALSGRGKTARLWVSNAYAAGAGVDYSRFFDRFYREDQAHNVEKGGYGIGLSIAEGLAAQYNGHIDVSWKDGVITFACLLR